MNSVRKLPFSHPWSVSHPASQSVRQAPLLTCSTRLQDTVGDFKARLADVIGVAANKQKLAREGVGFLRDEFSLAYYNVSPDVVLALGTKTRGGRK